MPLMFKKNGTTYHFPPYNNNDDFPYENPGLKTKRRTPSIAYKYDGNIYYAPCLSSTSDYVEDDKFRYTWSSSIASKGLRFNNTTYHLANVRKYKKVKTEGYFNSITYTRTRLSNGYYKVVFTINYYVKACTTPVGVDTGSWKIDLAVGPDDITYTTAWDGAYSGTTTTSQTSTRSFSCTCSVTCTGGDAVTAKDRWFSFCIHSNEVNMNYQSGTFEKKVTEAWRDGYDIPAGTYTPSAFKNLISQYISTNGTRKCTNAFTAKVNNQTISVSSGQTIAYKNCGTSPWLGTFVDFSGSTANVNAYSASSSFTGSKAYCVGLSNSSETGGGTGSYPNMFHGFTSYSITITTGINFQ